jgi:hypothetical protein
MIAAARKNADDANDEVAGLIRTLHETEQRTRADGGRSGCGDTTSEVSMRNSVVKNAREWEDANTDLSESSKIKNRPSTG